MTGVGVRLRLSLFMFGQYFMLGVWFVTLGTYMSKSLHFDGTIGVAYAGQGLAAILSSLFVGVVADRIAPAQRVLAVLMLASAATLFALAAVRENEALFLALVLVHFLAFVPTIPLSNAIALHALTDPAAEFAKIRVCGTLGWIAGGVLVGSIENAALTPLPILLAAAAGVALAFYAPTLPAVPPGDRGRSFSVAGALGIDVLAKVRDRSFWAVIACSVLVSVALAFYNAYCNPFLQEARAVATVLGKRFEPSALQSLGQISELGFLLLLPWVLRRIGIGGVLVAGTVGWMLRATLFGLGFSGGGETFTGLLVIGIVLHGVCYDFVMIAASLFVDRSLDATARSRAQAFLTMATMGVGILIGSMLANIVYAAATITPDAHDWRLFWLVPGAIAGATLLLFLATFRAWRVREWALQA